MKRNNNMRSERTNSRKLPVRSDKTRRSARYNYTAMKDETAEFETGFHKRLAQLRTARGVSAREMSLSLGQGAGYINNIENGRSLPSMAMFFEICEYLQVSPGMFFEYIEMSDSNTDLVNAVGNLSSSDRDMVMLIIERLSMS